MDLSGTFAALGDPTRLTIVERLIREGEMSAGEICAATDLSAPAVSRHLKVLSDVGLLRRRAVAQRRLYSAEPGAIGRIAAWTGSHRAFWEASLDRLDAALKEEDPDG